MEVTHSIRYIRRIKVMNCHTLVSPGIGATVVTFEPFKVFMRLDFPTFGYPISPTLICFRSLCRDENCRRRDMSWPLPKELVIEEWNAKVGTSFDKWRTHAAW